MKTTIQARHEQVGTWLLSQIQQGDWKPNEKLPSENALCTQFGVSRITVRHALQALENDGFIYRRQGMGSFVRPSAPPQPLLRLTDFSEEMANVGLKASSKVLFFGKDAAPDLVATCLNVGIDTPIIRLDRLRLGNDEAIAIDVTWLPVMYGQFIDESLLAEKTLFEILEDMFQISMERGRYLIEAVAATEAQAVHLGVALHSPLLKIRRVIFTSHDKPVFVQERYYPPHRIAYCMEVHRVDNQRKSCVQVEQFEPLFLNTT